MFKVFAISRFFLVMLSVLVLSLPVVAQDDTDGGILRGIFVGAATSGAELDLNLSPYYCQSFDCAGLVNLTTIGLFGIDPAIGWYAPGQDGALVRDWVFSENNRVLTLYLRDDLSWSDGLPMTAGDVMMSYELGLNAASNRNGEQGVRQLQNTITSVEMVNDYTLRVMLPANSCDLLTEIANMLYVLPEHVYRQLIDEVGYADLRDHAYFRQPTVSSGRFVFDSIADDGLVTLKRNEYYVANELGRVVPSAWVQVYYSFNMPDLRERVTGDFLSGYTHILDVQPADIDYAQTLVAAGQAQLVEQQAPSFSYMQLNQADADYPQRALDDNNQRIEQGLHPVFGDKLVRQAIAYTIDVNAIIQDVYSGYGTQMPSFILPNTWALDVSLAPLAYDLQGAIRLLAEAGWVPENTDFPPSIDNVLVCQDCLYATDVDSDYNGSVLQFDLAYNETSSYNIGEARYIQEQLAQVGIDVTLVPLSSEMLNLLVNSQTYDAALSSVRTGYPYTPPSEVMFSALADNPDVTGISNTTSFYNEAFYALQQTANTVEGCGLTERSLIYGQMQQLIQDELPLIPLVNGRSFTVVGSEVEGLDPYPLNPFWNLDTWWVIDNE